MKEEKIWLELRDEGRELAAGEGEWKVERGRELLEGSWENRRLRELAGSLEGGKELEQELGAGKRERA